MRNSAQAYTMDTLAHARPPQNARAVAVQAERYAAFLDVFAPAVIAAACELTEVRSVFFPADLLQHPGVVEALLAHPNPAQRVGRLSAGMKAGRKLVQNCLVRAVAQGVIQRLGPRSGYRSVGVQRKAVTLASLLSYAQRHVSATVFAKMKTSAQLIAEGLHGVKSATDRVGVGDLLWDSTHQRWAILPRVEQWSRDLRKSPPATMADHRLYATRLLDLGANAGLLSKGSQRHPHYVWDAGDLTPLVDELTDLVTRDENAHNTRCLRGGLRVLGAYARKQGAATESQVDWDAVRRAVQADRYTSPDLTGTTYHDARWAFNRLRGINRISAEPWGRVRLREGLVEHRAVTAAVEKGDWSGWVDADGQPYLALLGPADVGADAPKAGLRAYILWLDARLAADTLRQRGYPPRERYKPTANELKREAKRAKAGHPDFARQPDSLRGGLSRINHFLGWAKDQKQIDWRTATLDEVLTEEMLLAYALDYRAARGGADAGDGWESNSLYSALQLLGRYCTPFRARQVAATDAAAADALHAAGGIVIARAEWYRVTPDPEKLKAKVLAWQPDGEKGYLKLLRLVDLAREEIVAQGGGLSLREQRERLAAGTLSRRAPLIWARTVRMALMLHVSSRFPARAENLGEFRLEWIIPERPELATRLWESAITISTPADAVKNWEALTLELCGPVASDERVPEGVPRFDRDLMALYLMPGGARDILLTAAPGEAPCASPYLFVSDARAGSDDDSSDRAWSDRADAGFPWSSVSTEFGRVVDRHALRLGLDPARMIGGSKGLHIIRHLFASFFVVTHPEYASKMLGHRSPQTTRMTYAWVEGLDFNYEQEMAEASAHHAARRRGPNSSAVAPTPAVPARSASTDTIDRECPHCGEERRILKSGQVARFCRACGQDSLAAA